MGGGVDQAVATASLPYMPDTLGVPNTGSTTRLSTDYLNHFTEAVMALEMVATMPDCQPDLEAWKPKTYCEHFAAYWAADPDVRRNLDTASATLNAAVEETRDAVLAQLSTPGGADLAKRLVAELKPLIARTAAVINGTAAEQDRGDTQAAIDALFDR